jgi:hypothetical protein
MKGIARRRFNGAESSGRDQIVSNGILATGRLDAEGIRVEEHRAVVGDGCKILNPPTPDGGLRCWDGFYIDTRQEIKHRRER